MAGRRRPPAERAALEAKARGLRMQGLGLIEIGRVVGVPASTLARWAAETGWRLEDLPRKAPAPAIAPPASAAASRARPGQAPPPDAPPTHPPTHSPGDAEAGASPDTPPDAPADTPADPPPDPHASARAVLADAARLAAEGDFVAADRAARVGEKLVRLAGQLPPAPEPADGETRDARQILGDYLDRLAASMDESGTRRTHAMELAAWLDAWRFGEGTEGPSWFVRTIEAGEPIQPLFELQAEDQDAFAARVAHMARCSPTAPVIREDDPP